MEMEREACELVLLSMRDSPDNTLVDARVPLFQGKEQDPGPVLVIPKLSVFGYWALVGYFVPCHIDCSICY